MDARPDTERVRPQTATEEKMEADRVEQLRRDARRLLSVNLAETIELSHFVLSLAGSARRRS